MKMKGVALCAALLLCLLLSGCQQLPPLPPLDSTTYEKAGPSEVDMLTIGASVCGLSFEDARGGPFVMSQDMPLVLVYWASWGQACQEALPRVDALAQSVAQAGGTLLLVNKTDGVVETRETALDCLREAGVATPTLFDMGDAAYNALRIDYVPTVFAVDAGGTITSLVSGGVPEEAELLSMLAEAQAGKAARMEAVIAALLVDGDGGIHTSYLPEGAGPAGEDVLSESQGLMMRYAALAGDAALFERAWQYVQAHLTTGGLAQWVSGVGQGSAVNATVDDLRICRALLESGRHSVEGMTQAKAMRQYVAPHNRLVDFYDFSLRQHAGQLTLCYADFAALEMLAYRDGTWKPILDGALAVVTNGRISDAFPLYHARYDYATGAYSSGETLHMAEALLTLQHLAEVDRLPPDAYDWLRGRLLEDGCIYTRYTADGMVATDGQFESSAVYAVAARIALLQEDVPLARVALTKMEALRVREAGSVLDGALGNADGTGIHSFDQLKALLAYQAYEALE